MPPHRTRGSTARTTSPNCRPHAVGDGASTWPSGEDDALHSYGHRVESVVSLTVGRGKSFDAVDPQNPWRLFSLTDKDYPGHAGVGDVHVPANGAAEYQLRQPAARHVDGRGLAALPRAHRRRARMLDRTAWGCTQLGYQRWYLAHLPHAPGSTPWGCNDWSTCGVIYDELADYDRNLEPVAGAAPPLPLCDLLGAGLPPASVRRRRGRSPAGSTRARRTRSTAFRAGRPRCAMRSAPGSPASGHRRRARFRAGRRRARRRRFYCAP